MTTSRALVLSFFVTLFFSTVSYPQNRSCDISIINSDGKEVALQVELADTPDKRSSGLMFRRILGENEGMLFIFDESESRSFWMRNTYIPLSIAYISDRGVINEIYQMKPLDDSIIYSSKKPARYALEMKQGWFRRNNITSGCVLKLNGCLGQ